MVCANPFLTTQVENGVGLEYVADQVLIPVHYLLAARVAKPVEVADANGVIQLHYKFEQRFQYNDSLFWLKTASSIAALPVSLTAGVLLKASAYLSPVARSHFSAVCASDSSRYVESKIEYYKSLGLQIGNYDEAEFIDPPKHVRRSGDEFHMTAEKEVLKEILQIFAENNIVSWVDCGTCLGAYRYGGVIPWDTDIDLAILEEDHHNVHRALGALDPSKYIVQDWSARSCPNSYLRVYVKETGSALDIYHYRIDPETKTIRTVLSFDQNIFMLDCWLTRERRLLEPVSFECVFPLKKANFDGIIVPIAGQVEPFIQAKYGKNLNPVKIYNEVIGMWEKDLSHPYWERAYAN